MIVSRANGFEVFGAILAASCKKSLLTSCIFFLRIKLKTESRISRNEVGRRFSVFTLLSHFSCETLSLHLAHWRKGCTETIRLDLNGADRAFQRNRCPRRGCTFADQSGETSKMLWRPSLFRPTCHMAQSQPSRKSAKPAMRNSTRSRSPVAAQSIIRLAILHFETEVRINRGKLLTASSNTRRKKINSSDEYTVSLPNISFSPTHQSYTIHDAIAAPKLNVLPIDHVLNRLDHVAIVRSRDARLHETTFDQEIRQASRDQGPCRLARA
jgi:hypothetical protein